MIELACHTKSCAPPPVGVGGSTPVGGSAPVSTRMPTAVKADKPLHGLGTRLDEIPISVAAKQVEAIATKVPGFGHLKDHPGLAKGASEADQRAVVDAAVDQIAANVIEVYDRSPNPEVTRNWYDAANKLSADLGAEYGVEPEVAAAVIASLSPQADWDQNVQQARLVLDTMTGNPAISPADVKAINRIAVQQHDKAIVAWKAKVAKAESTGNADAIAKAKAKRPAPPEKLDPDSIGSIKQLSELEAAYFIRHKIGEKVPHKHMEVLEDGGYRLEKTVLTAKGGEWGMRWQTYGNLADAVGIIRDPTTQNVSERLGGEHKVRSFYNNIAHPNSPQHDVTMDTHAFGIATRIPLTSNHPLIKSGSGNIYGTPSNAAAGTKGVHVVLAEGYRRATDTVNRRKGRGKPKRPLLPREMQSVTWEQWRNDYPAVTRTKTGSTQTQQNAERILRTADAEGWNPSRIDAELGRLRA